MSLPLKSQQELYELFQNTIQNSNNKLTDFLEGSILDGLAGVFSIAGTELQRTTTKRFNQTFFNLAEGPDENDGGPDDLEALAIDHFGDSFARPGAEKAIDFAVFSRPTAAFGSLTIPSGTVVKTAPDPNGNAQRYTTDTQVVMGASGPSSLQVSVGITAVVAGAAGSAVAGAINIIESSLLDNTVVVTNVGNQTGADAQDSPTYRETIRNLILADKGATTPSLEAAAKTVAGVKIATIAINAIPVKKWDIANSLPVGIYFYVPDVTLYIADASGSANQNLINAVYAALAKTEATGVNIKVASAVAVPITWIADITLNPDGPNFSTLQLDLSNIYNAMKTYINSLPVGTGLKRVIADKAMMTVFGPGGTNDITAFRTVEPTADVSAPFPYSKLIAASVGST